MNAAVIDQTDELLRMGAAEYPDIVKLERAVDRARSRRTQSAEENQELYERAQDLEALRENARSAFAEPLGWVSCAPFALAALLTADSKEASPRFTGTLKLNRDKLFVGCADFFLDESGRQIGIVGHTKRPWHECHDFGTSYGLQVDALPDSWHGPGALIAVLYTRQGYIPPQRA